LIEICVSHRFLYVLVSHTKVQAHLDKVREELECVGGDHGGLVHLHLLDPQRLHLIQQLAVDLEELGEQVRECA
jgi:hypothetical protein